jgi:hypothetical protein
MFFPAVSDQRFQLFRSTRRDREISWRRKLQNSQTAPLLNCEICCHETSQAERTDEPACDKQPELVSALNPKNFNEEKFYPFDKSCEGRFGKLVALNIRQLESIETDDAAVNRAWSVVNAVDTPMSSLYCRGAWCMVQCPEFSLRSAPPLRHGLPVRFRLCKFSKRFGWQVFLPRTRTVCPDTRL